MPSKQQTTGQFSACIVTNVGKEMIAKSQNGEKLVFTRVALGDGLLEDSDNIINFTKIKNEKLSANIAKWTNKQNGQFQIQFKVSNQNVETGFWQREIGIMAKLEGGKEQLYAYTSSGNGADFLYDKTTPVDERIVNIDFVIGNAENVQVVVNSSIIYVTLKDMEEAMATHNTNADSHTEAFAQHNADLNAHNNLFNKKLDKTGGTLTGDLNASGHNITATKFIGALQGIADTATKATQDKNGLQIDTNYLKLAGGSMQGLLNLFANSTVPTPAAQDNSKKITNTEWVQAWVKSFVTQLSTNIEVETQEDGHFSCPALGITGLMAQNGYICLGKLFGNLILQWGFVEKKPVPSSTIPLNIAVNNLLSVIAIDINTTSNPLVLTTANYNKNNFLLCGYRLNTNYQDGLWAHWICIGK